MTTRVQLPGGAELVAECDPRRDEAAMDLLQALLRRDAAGPALHPGSVVDVGWAPLQVREGGPRSWQLCEPVYGAEPMDWRPGLDITLAVLDSQASLVRSVGAKAVATRCTQWLLLAPGVLDSPAIFLERKTGTSRDDSGWYAGLQDSAVVPDRRLAQRLAVGDLVLRKPAWLQVLALPPGSMAFFEGERLETIMDAANREIYPPPAGEDPNA